MLSPHRFVPGISTGLVALVAATASADPISFTEQSNAVDVAIIAYDGNGQPSTFHKALSNNAVGSYSGTVNSTGHIGSVHGSQNTAVSSDTAVGSLFAQASGSTHTSPGSNFASYDWTGDNSFAVTFELTETITFNLDYTASIDGFGSSFVEWENLDTETLVLNHQNSGNGGVDETFTVGPGTYELRAGTSYFAEASTGDESANFDLTVTVIPEPATAAVWLAPAAALLLRRRRTR